AACSACAASSASCTAVLIRSSAITSATTWPDAAVALVCAWQPLPPVRQLPLVVEPSAGGPRAPFAPPPATGPSMPAAELRTDPAQPRPPPEQSSVASTIVQLDAPGTVGAPECAGDPCATVAGAAGSSGPGSAPRGASPVVSELTVALAVERWATSGVITFADGSDEAPEFVTARHTPPSTPSQDPSLREPRGVADTSGSVAVAAHDAAPVHGVQPVQAIAAPEAEAADGPAASRAAFTGRGPPASARTAPGPLEAVEIERAAHPSVAPVQDAVPSEVRTSAPSRAVVLVRTVPAHAVAAAHSSVPYAVAVDDGPLVGCPGRGKPVSGSVATK